jgi:YHS domain-containing protein
MWRLFAYLCEFIFVVIIGRLLNRATRSIFRTRPANPGAPPGGAGQAENVTRSGETVRDPVCGIFVSTELSYRLTSGAQTLHFCSQECLERYQKNTANAASI